MKNDNSTKLNGKTFDFGSEFGVLKIFGDLKRVAFGLDKNEVWPLPLTQIKETFG